MKHLLLALLCIGSISASQRSASAPLETQYAEPGSFAAMVNEIFEKEQLDPQNLHILVAVTQVFKQDKLSPEQIKMLVPAVKYLDVITGIVRKAEQVPFPESAYDIASRALKTLGEIATTDLHLMNAAKLAFRIQRGSLLTWYIFMAVIRENFAQAQSAAEIELLEKLENDFFEHALPDEFMRAVNSMSVVQKPSIKYCYDVRKAQTSQTLYASLKTSLLPELLPIITSYAVAPGTVLGDHPIEYRNQLQEKRKKDVELSFKSESHALVELTGLDAIAHIDTARTVDLSDNLLTNLGPQDLAPLVKVRKLHLDHNDLRHITDNTFAACPRLRTLHLWSNPIVWSNGILGGLRKLRVLNIRNSNLQHPPANLLHGVPNLTDLNISKNPLLRLLRGFFVNCPRLKKIDLSICQLEVIEHGTFGDTSHIEALDLRVNPSLHRAPVNEIHVPGLLIDAPVLHRIGQRNRPRRNSI